MGCALAATPLGLQSIYKLCSDEKKNIEDNISDCNYCCNHSDSIAQSDSTNDIVNDLTNSPPSAPSLHGIPIDGNILFRSGGIGGQVDFDCYQDPETSNVQSGAKFI